MSGSRQRQRQLSVRQALLVETDPQLFFKRLPVCPVRCHGKTLANLKFQALEAPYRKWVVTKTATKSGRASISPFRISVAMWRNQTLFSWFHNMYYSVHMLKGAITVMKNNISQSFFETVVHSVSDLHWILKSILVLAFYAVCACAHSHLVTYIGFSNLVDILQFGIFGCPHGTSCDPIINRATAVKARKYCSTKVEDIWFFSHFKNDEWHGLHRYMGRCVHQELKRNWEKRSCRFESEDHVAQLSVAHCNKVPSTKIPINSKFLTQT